MQQKNNQTVTESNFEREVLTGDRPVLVDFWAEWCGPCRQIAPTIDQLAEEFAGKAKVRNVDVDREQALAARFRVFSIPTLLFFRNGKVVDRLVGAVPKQVLEEKLNTLLAA